MICPQCGRNMTSTTPEKSYCMKCDILIHAPSGVAYTGHPEEDKFIGVPGVLLNETRKEFASTLAPDALVLTWKDGKEYGTERVLYSTVTGLKIAERKQSEIASVDSIAGGFLAGGLFSTIELALTNVKTLKIKTERKEYEIWVPQAAEWANRIHKQTPQLL